MPRLPLRSHGHGSGGRRVNGDAMAVPVAAAREPRDLDAPAVRHGRHAVPLRGLTCHARELQRLVEHTGGDHVRGKQHRRDADHDQSEDQRLEHGAAERTIRP